MDKGKSADDRAILAGNPNSYKRDFWSIENQRFAIPHFRMTRAVAVVRRIAGERECDLLDVGCGPAAVQRLVPRNVHYYGIDIAISDPAPNLLELDVTQAPVDFHGRKFDIILVQGVFEYLSEYQDQKLAELQGLLKPGGKLVVTYTNFAHRKRTIYGPYNNVQQPEEFRRNIRRYFIIEKYFPTAYNWNHTHPNRKLLAAVQSRFSRNVPVIGRKLAIDYLYVCRAKH